MKREEFCNNLPNIRKESGIKMKDLCFQMDTMPTTIYRIERGVFNFSVEKIIEYLKCMDKYIYLSKKKSKIALKEYKDVVKWLKKNRGTKFAQRDLADAIDCSYSVIAFIELSKSVMSIDILLKLADFFEYEITIESE